MSFKEVREGLVKIKVPDVDLPERGEVFYNPEMEMDRDISVAFMNVASPEKVCDALAASGVRGIRYKKETSAKEVYVNDANEKASALIKENAEANKAELIISNQDANILLRKNKFDFVDIDPFGSPVPFLDSAARSFFKKGFMAVTSTDTATLTGVYPEVCWRRYGVESLTTDYSKELGLRTLITAIMKVFHRLDYSFIPKMAYSRRHYFRVFGEVNKGAKLANRTRKDFGYISHCFKCGWRKKGLILKCEHCGAKTEICGEIYTGPIQDKKIIERVKEYLLLRKYKQTWRETKLLNLLKEEINVPFYYDVHKLCKKINSSVPKLETINKKLKQKGFSMSRTHFSSTGIKTNAPFKIILDALTC